MFNDTTRRSMVRKVGAVAVGLGIGATGSAAAADSEEPDIPVSPDQTKTNYIRFEISSGEGNPEYTVTVPDADATLDNIDNGPVLGNDTVTRNDNADTTFVDGNLNGANEPYYDALAFDGSLDSPDFSYDAEPDIAVVVNGEIKQQG